MKRTNLLKASVASLAIFTALSPTVLTTAAHAQQITSGVRGLVSSSDGSPVSGASVTITDTRTGASRTTTTGSTGNYNLRGLSVGGPYTLRVSSAGYDSSSVTDIALSLSGASTIDIALRSGSAVSDELVVVASRNTVTNVAVGPNSSFDLAAIEALPSVNRQIRDVIRVDPRVNVSRSGGGQGFQVNCLGGNSRGNAFTIDGIRSGDSFGLNASGNSARNTFPIPFDTIGATSVEFSPIDVQYGQFTGCAINVTTKSGTNEFHGSAFGLFTSDTLTGDQIEDQQIASDFTNWNWGAELGGPIIKDKLFFYGSYEETSSGLNQDEGIGAGFANPLTSNPGDGEAELFTLENAARFGSAVNSIFGRDPGEQVTTLPQTSRRFFGRLDWNITDNHRAEVTYANLEEATVFGDAIGGGRGEFTFSDNFQTVGSSSDTYSFRLFSNWTDNFSTEFRLSRNDIIDIQNPLGGGEQQSDDPIVRVAVGDGNEFFGQDFASGPGIFRSANELNTQVDQIKFAGTYVADNHTFTIGYEADRLDVFNLFVINATGTVFFSDLDALEAATPTGINQNGSFSGDINDAAAAFRRTNHTLYAQDEWQVTDRLQIVAGIRYDFFTSGDGPNLNPVFQDRFGISNAQAFDGFEIIQPRVGLTYELPAQFGQTTVTAGYGRFTGGDPSVFFSNAFQNFGGTIGVGDVFVGDVQDLSSNDFCTDADLTAAFTGGTFNGLPACILQEQQARTAVFDAEVAATDPNFTPPSVDRFNFGISHYTEGTGFAFFDDWQANFEVIYSLNRNAIDFVDLSIAQNGTAPDGRPIFANIDPLLAGCNATLNSDLRSFDNTSAACFDGANVPQQIVLTNAINGDGSALSISAQLAKQFDVFSSGTFDIRLGYAFSDAEVGNAGNSSTAGSNFEEVITSDFSNVPVFDSFFNNRHNFVVNATYRDEFFKDLATTFGAFFRVRTGRQLSFVFDNSTSADAFGDSDDEARSLLFIPDGPNDPRVAFAPGFDQDAFFNFINENDLDQFAGQILEGGLFTQPTNADLDLRFSQELPVPVFTGHKVEFSVNFENFLNFISSGAGVQRFVDTSNTAEGIDVVGATIVDGQFLFDDLNTNPIDIDVDTNDTLWRIQFGVKYRF